MSKHITPPPRADQTDKATEPDRRASRFDERGIALQTVIIMVVLLARAGGIAAVLLNRGSEAADQLEQQETTVAPNTYENKALCEAAGNTWVETGNSPKVDPRGYEDSGGTAVAGPTCYK